MKFKILIVDDDKNFVETLRDSLKEKDVNIDIIVSACAKDAFLLLSQEIPDIIILDMQLEDMHGIDFMKTLKDSEKLKNIPIIFISARYTEPTDRANALLSGGKAFFSKPVDIEGLWREIRYFINNKKE